MANTSPGLEGFLPKAALSKIEGVEMTIEGCLLITKTDRQRFAGLFLFGQRAQFSAPTAKSSCCWSWGSCFSLGYPWLDSISPETAFQIISLPESFRGNSGGG
jgi:hypothetical protein